MAKRFHANKIEKKDDANFSSFADAHVALSKGEDMDSSSTSSSDWLASITRLLDEKLCPVEVSARFAEAAFWHCQEVAIRPGQSNGWLVLVGDAACGRPFYLGSTLNGHIHDVVPLAHCAPWANWDADGAPL